LHIKDTFFVMNIVGTATILYGVLRFFQNQKQRVMKYLEIEQIRSEKLLLNILPAAVAVRLKSNDMRIADHYDEVTVLFADLINFTRISKEMQPTQLVELLSQIFLRFDQLAEKFQIEKIKTIGDAYMAVSGAPVECTSHATRIADMALAMQSVLKEIGLQTGLELSMRIGIHTGPVVAGVIGISKFSYDLWGDTVNMASRMEETCPANSIQITQQVWQLLADDFLYAPRFGVAVKGKGYLDTYLLLGRR
jgi:guanylate cyclase